MFESDYLQSRVSGAGPGDLIDVGRVGGKRVLLGAQGRLELVPSPGSVWIGDRRSGVETELPWSIVPRLVAACRHWARERDGWAAFYASAAGFPGGFGALYFLAPGAASEPVAIGTNVPGSAHSGREFTGWDQDEPLFPTVDFDGIRVTRTIRRVGEARTPPGGLQTGVVYDLGDGWEIRAYRTEAFLGGHGQPLREAVRLEVGDEAVAEALPRLRGRHRGRSA